MVVVILLLAEVVGVALRYGYSIATLVEVATIFALSFPVYSFWRMQFDKKRELVDAVRMWVARFQHMVDYIPSSLTPNEVTLVLDNVRKIAEDTADNLSEALAKGEPYMEKLLSETDRFIVDLRNFAKILVPANVDGARVLVEVGKLLSKAATIQEVAKKELERFALRNGVPVKYSFLVDLALMGLVGFLAGLLVRAFL